MDTTNTQFRTKGGCVEGAAVVLVSFPEPSDKTSDVCGRVTQFNSCIHVFHSSTSVYRGQLHVCGWSIRNTQISWIKATHLDLCYWNRGEQSIQLSTLLLSMCWPCYSTIPCALLHGKTIAITWVVWLYTQLMFCSTIIDNECDLLLFQLQVIGSTMFLLQKKTFTNIAFLWNNIHKIE